MGKTVKESLQESRPMWETRRCRQCAMHVIQTYRCNDICPGCRGVTERISGTNQLTFDQAVSAVPAKKRVNSAYRVRPIDGLTIEEV